METTYTPPITRFFREGIGLYTLLVALGLLVLSGLEELGRKLYKILKHDSSFHEESVLANGEKRDISLCEDTKFDLLYKEVNAIKIMIAKLEETVSHRKI